MIKKIRFYPSRIVCSIPYAISTPFVAYYIYDKKGICLGFWLVAGASLLLFIFLIIYTINFIIDYKIIKKGSCSKATVEKLYEFDFDKNAEYYIKTSYINEKNKRVTTIERFDYGSFYSFKIGKKVFVKTNGKKSLLDPSKYKIPF